jgi:uncharacterized membrane protein YqjE
MNSARLRNRLDVRIAAAFALLILFLVFACWMFARKTYDLPNRSAKSGINLSQDRRFLEAPVTQVINEH